MESKMHPHSIEVWYFCKECTVSFQKLEDFFEHKNRIHFSEFQSTKCIVFEERIKKEDPEDVSSPATLTQHFEPQLNEGEVVCGLQDSLNISDTDLHFDINTQDSFKYELSENDTENIGDETVSQNLQIDSDLGVFSNVNVNEDVKPAIFSSVNTSNEETMETTTTTGENIDPLSFDFEPQAQAQLAIYRVKVENDSQNISYGIDTRVKALQNPYIRLTRLTSKEIEQYKQSFSQPNSGNISPSFKHESDISIPATSVNSFKCQLCSKKLLSEPELQIHVGICSLDHIDRNLFCALCNRKFSKKHSLKAHCRRYHGTNELMNESKRSTRLPFNGQLMSTNGKVTVQFSSLMQRQFNGSKRKGRKLHKCDQCDYSSPRKDNVNAHKAYKHSNNRPFKCSQPNCGKAFKMRAHLVQHRISHSVETPFHCNYPNCDSVFKRKGSLFDHEVTHASQWPFTNPQPSCDQSGIICQGTNELVNQSNHALPDEKAAVNCSSTMQPQVTGFKNKIDKAHKCDQCGFSSDRRDKLAAHKERMHSSDKIRIKKWWLCSQPNCGKTFKTRSQLREHSTFHWDKKPFHCNYPDCDKVFKLKCNLDDHELTHSSPVPFTCPLPNCEHSFKLRHQLKKHLQEFHFVEPTSITPVRARSRPIPPKGANLHI